MFKRKRNNNKNFKKRMNWEDSVEYPDSNFPKDSMNEGKVNSTISVKSLSGLPHSSYSVKADPYSASLPLSSPYQLLGTFLKTVGGNYRGLDNIDGGNIQQYANSTTSKMLDYFDSFRMKLSLNYRYLPISTSSNAKLGLSLVDEMRKSIAEAVSVLNSTTFTSLAINNFAVETDLPMGSGKTTNIANGSTEIQAYTSTTDVLYAMSIYYQIFLQEALSVMNWHNSFRLKQGTAIRDAWGREVPNLNSFFGLMNKKAFLSLLDSINLSFEGEYIDKDYMEQVNYLSFMPSRRSNAFTDPVLELQVKMNHPLKFKVYVLGANGKIADPNDLPLYNDADLKLSFGPGGQETVVSYWDACDNLKDYLSLEATKRWARSSYTPGGINGTDNDRYNTIKSYFDVLIASFVHFKPLWADYRECLDVMTRTGAISWTKGFRPAINKDTDAPLFRNLIVDDIYKMVMSGNNTLKFNTATKRWETFAQWNMYTGIPEYDAKQGGSFITFSSKDLSALSDSESLGYLPIMFDPNPSSNNIYVVGISRKGAACNLTYDVVNISNDNILQRLAPLASQADLTIRVPYLRYSNNNKLTSSERSTLYKTLTQIFGFCKIGLSATTTDTALDSDVLSVYQIEISDITNEAITYARANAPFRGTASDQGLLGFFGISK